MIGSLARFPCLLAILCATAVAQSPPPSASAAGAAGSTLPPVATIRANAKLVVLDVVVTDSSNKPVHGLKATDFALLENNTPQTVKHFEEHSAGSLAEATKLAPMPKLAPGVFTNYAPAPETGAVNLLLLDSLNTPINDQAYARRQLLAYLKSMKPGTRVAIFGLTSQLVQLQGFTSDPAVLKDILAKGLDKASVKLNDLAGAGGTQNNAADDMEDLQFDTETVANMRQFDAMRQSFDLQFRAKYTLDAMSQIARYLSVIPGRKNLIWFSASFPLDLLPDATISRPFDVVENSDDKLKEAVDLLARNQIAVYPIDSRGLTNPPMYDAATGRNYTDPATGTARMNQDRAKFVTDTADENSTMQIMAKATGGRAFVSTNGLTEAVTSAISEGSNFYTLTYTPSNSSRNGDFRKIKVQLARHGYNLAYRQGYFAIDPDKIQASSSPGNSGNMFTAGSNPQNSLNISALNEAMTRGAPTPTEILIKVGVVPINLASSPEDKPAPGNKPAGKTHGPYRRYAINYSINPADLAFQATSDGQVHIDFDLLISVFDSDGAVVNSQNDTVHMAGSLKEIHALIAKDIIHHEEISAPLKGEYFFRIAVRDQHRDRYGAVEVAASTIKNLVPAAAPSVLPAPEAPR